MYVDPRIAAGMSDEVLKAVDEAQTVVAAVYVVPTRARWKLGRDGRCDRHAAAAVAGSRGGENGGGGHGESIPGRRIFRRLKITCALFRMRSVSEVAAVKALFGEIPIRGHLPVSIPNIAQRGAGLERPAQLEEEGLRMGKNNFSGMVLVVRVRRCPCICSGCSVNVKKENERTRTSRSISELRWAASMSARARSPEM